MAQKLYSEETLKTDCGMKNRQIAPKLINGAKIF